MALDPDILAAIESDTTASGGGFLSGLGNVIGAPKHFMDYLARQGSRLQGLNVPDTATTGSLFRAGLGMSPEQQEAEKAGYGARIAGRALEFGGDIATDPLTYAMGGLGATARGGKTAQAALKSGFLGEVPEAAAAAERMVRAGKIAAPIQKGATAAFTGLMGAGALQEGAQAASTIAEEGFTPRAAEETFGTILSAGGALASGAHMKGLLKEQVKSPGEVVTDAVRAASDQELASRLDSYERSGEKNLAAIVRAEKDWRADKKAGVSPDTPPEEAALRKALMGLSTKRNRTQTDLQLMVEAVGEGKLTSDDAYSAWKSSNKLPDVLGTSTRAEAVAAPPPTPPDQLAAALQASIEAKGVKPVRTAEEISKELSVASPEAIEQMLPKDFNDLLRQRGFTVPRVKEVSAYDKARKVIEDETARTTQLPPEAGALQPPPGSPLATPGGDRGGVVGPEATPIGAAGVPGSAPLLVSGRLEPTGILPSIEERFAKVKRTKGVKEPLFPEEPALAGEAPIKPSKGKTSTFSIGEAEDALADVKYPTLEFDTPTDKYLHFLQEQVKLPEKERNVPGIKSSLKALKEKGITGAGLEEKPIFKDISKPEAAVSPYRKWADLVYNSKDIAPERTQDFALIQDDARVQGVQNAFKDLLDESSEAMGATFGRGALNAYMTEASGLTGQEGTLAYNRQEGGRNTIALNIPVLVVHTLDRLLQDNRPLSDAPKVFMSELRQLTRHEPTHSLPGTRHEGDVVGDPMGAGWKQTPTASGLAGPIRDLVEQKGYVPTARGPKPSDQFHTLQEMELTRELAKRPTPFSDSLMTEAAEPYLKKVWEDAVSVAPELESMLQPEKARELGMLRDAFFKEAAKTKGRTVLDWTTAKKRVGEVKGAPDRSSIRNAEPPPEGATIDLGALKKRLDTMKKITTSEKAEILKVAKAEPEKLEEVLRKADNPTKLEKAIEAWKMGLLSGPSTIMIQGFDFLEAGSRTFEAALAPLVDKVMGGPRTRFSGEAKSEVKGYLRQHHNASEQFWTDLKEIAKAAPEVIDPERPLEFQTGKIGGKTGRIIRTPARLMNATSKYLRTVGSGAELSKLAYREAISEMGAKAPEAELQKRAGEIYNKAIDPSNEAYAEMVKAAKKGGKERVFEEEPGPLINALLKMRSENPWMHGLLPFLHVPGNITKLIGQRSPLGFVKAAKSYASYRRALGDAETSPTKLAELKAKAVDDITRPLFGLAVMTAFAGATAMGNMTGGGPVDKKKKNLLLAGGWQPYSFVLPGELFGEPKGSKFYIPYKRIQPLGALLGFAADTIEAINLKDGGDKFEKGLESLGQNLTSQNYFQGLADAMEFISNPREMAAQYASSQAGSLVPNIFAKVAQSIDPISRETRSMDRGVKGMSESVLRSVQARVPGLSTQLPPKISATGEEIQRPGNAASRLLSFTQPTLSKPNQEFIEFLASIDAVPGLPSKEIVKRGVKIPLEEGEWKDLSRANQEAMTYIEANYFNDPTFRALPRIRQKRYIDAVFSRMREQERNQMLRTTPLGDRARTLLQAEG